MKKVLGIALGAGILLAACGSNGSPAASQKEVKFGEIMNKGKQISYVLRNYDESTTAAPNKDSSIIYILATDNGKVTKYRVNDVVTLKDIKDKSSDEIIELAKKQDKKYMNINAKRVAGYKYKEPEATKLKIKVVEDGTGNDTESERFFIVPHDTEENNSDQLVYEDNNNVYSEFNSGAGTMKIYDTNYAFLEDTEDDDPKDFLVTPVSDKTEFSELDKPGSKYVKIADED